MANCPSATAPAYGKLTITSSYREAEDSVPCAEEEAPRPTTCTFINPFASPPFGPRNLVHTTGFPKRTSS